MSEIIDNRIKSRLDQALHTSEPQAQLVKLVEALKIEGWNQLQIYDVFETYMFSLERQNRKNEENIVTEVVSYIYGWCSPNLRLFYHTLSNDEIKDYQKSKNQ